MSNQLFDLNIEEVLENWETHHAIREIIANALDEQVLTGTRPAEITKDGAGAWHVRDFGRGLRIEHFTLNENKEKLTVPADVIGKFGVGLKDALATFNRHGIDVAIHSSKGTFRLCKAPKHGFADISTLHVEYTPLTREIEGSDVILTGVQDEDIDRAKALFLKFAGEVTLDTTPFGAVLRRRSETARVYIMGVLANEESGFLFSYNITSLTTAMRKRLNRERLDVGRATYTDRVKSILKATRHPDVQRMLAGEVAKRATDGQCDEMQWIEVSQLALNYLAARQKVMYVTEREMHEHPDLVDNARRDQIEITIVSGAQRHKLDQQMEEGGPTVRTLDIYTDEYNASFEYVFVDPEELTPPERQVFELTPRLLALIGLHGKSCPPVRISETMRATLNDILGTWNRQRSEIIIKRSQLSSAAEFAGTLLHEAAHATSGKPDVTREFEEALTDYLGTTGASAIL